MENSFRISAIEEKQMRMLGVREVFRQLFWEYFDEGKFLPEPRANHGFYE